MSKFSISKESSLMRSDFIFGVATSSFQIEGAVNEGGRCESIWDRFCRTEGKVKGGDTGDIACDHYHLFESDLDLIAELGFDAYRFSIAWPRIETAPGQYSEEGFDFYDRLIRGLESRGIEPHVTLYHWDLPQFLEDKGGWVNRETAYHFANYAEKVAACFGNRVASYVTLNEPWCSAYFGYRTGDHAPGYADDKLGFTAAHHLLLGHGLAMPKLRAHAPDAKHGIVLNFSPAFPLTDSEADAQAAQFFDEENGEWFLRPVLQAEYPRLVAEKHPEWVPAIYPGDMEVISRPIDFLGINYYTRAIVKASEAQDYEEVPPTGDVTDFGWEIFPEGLTECLVRLKKKYGEKLPTMYITENGAADNTELVDGSVNDEMRTNYYRTHLDAVSKAIESGVDVKGYFAWSLMDNFEWAEGYSKRFGIVHVNYETQERTPKMSALAFQDLLQTKRQL